jgi:hypothetical protein
METTMSTPSGNIGYSNSQSIVKTLAWLGLLAGTLDICAAFLQAYIKRGTSPVIILKYIASAVFGKEAMTGGAMMAVWGLIFHFIIAYSCTIVFFLLYPKIKLLHKNMLLTIFIFGIAIWAITNLVIVPLSKIGTFTFVWDRALMALGILIIAIAWPVTYFTRRFYRGKL